MRATKEASSMIAPPCAPAAAGAPAPARAEAAPAVQATAAPAARKPFLVSMPLAYPSAQVPYHQADRRGNECIRHERDQRGGRDAARDARADRAADESPERQRSGGGPVDVAAQRVRGDPDRRRRRHDERRRRRD